MKDKITKLGVNHAASSIFSIKIIDRYTLLYQEHDHELIIEIADDIEPFRVHIYSNELFEWKPPFQKEIITEIEKEEIIRNIQSGLTFLEIHSELL